MRFSYAAYNMLHNCIDVTKELLLSVGKYHQTLIRLQLVDH